MLISSPSLIFIITTLAAAAVGLCYLPIVSDIVSAITARQKEKRLAQQSAKQSVQQLERKLLSYYQNVLKKIEGKTEKILAEQLSALGTAIKGDYEKNRQELKTATGKYLDETKIALAGLVQSAEKRVDEELTKEFKTTRAELENYKKNQIKKIEEEIAAIVEKTIYRTLGKGLALEDQVDLIYEALAEAKEEGFFEKNVE